MIGGEGISVASSPTFHRAFLEHLSVADGAFLMVLAFSLLLGLGRGFSRETGSVIVWGGALWLTARFNPLIIDALVHIVAPTARGAPIVVWAGRSFLFVMTLGVLNIFAQQAIQLTKNLLSGGIDHILGAAFGVVRGYVLLVIFFIVCGWAAPEWLEGLADKSIVAPYVVRGVAMVEGYLPPSLIEHLAFGATNSH